MQRRLKTGRRMSGKTDLLSLFKKNYAYNGRILRDSNSRALKKRLAKAIVHMDALEKIGTPIIPYIAAWRIGGRDIWYEYTGAGLKKMLNCRAGDMLAEAFRNNLSRQYLYRKQVDSTLVSKRVLNKKQVEQARRYLRKLGEKSGKSEAIYQIDNGGDTFWMKDIALIESYPESEVVLSLGTLIDVTNEIRLEETLAETKDQLEKHKLSLENMLVKRTAELHDAQLEVVTRLVQAAEFRDDQTGWHNKRLSRYVSIIGKAYGLTKGANWLLYNAVPMHDIGKVGIPDAILLKQGPLTPEERDIIKTHCRLGHELLDGGKSQLLEIAKAIALTHHEQWDGSGYPAGISGADIPLAGRIAAICDVFDALTTERPYKEAWPLADAVAEIRRLRGTKFDPKVVDIFEENLVMIQRIHREYLEKERDGIRPASSDT
ncbi:MAG TPA: hypothetical protein DHV36_01975 [Desulfobacteraceae bacterium]|nr:hypothetical protein [Desulfobacteraceae bacterium]